MLALYQELTHNISILNDALRLVKQSQGRRLYQGQRCTRAVVGGGGHHESRMSEGYIGYAGVLVALVVNISPSHLTVDVNFAQRERLTILMSIWSTARSQSPCV